MPWQYGDERLLYTSNHYLVRTAPTLYIHTSNKHLSNHTHEQLMTTAFGWYCLRDVIISLLLAISPPEQGVPAYVEEGAMGGMRAPEEGELNGVKLAASGESERALLM